MPVNSIAASMGRGLSHRTVWRWHFYAGLFCIPFILWLSVTGTVFLFHPQIQHWLDRSYNHLPTDGPTAPVNTQVQAALAAVPGSSLNAYQLPFDAHSPAQVLVDRGASEFRVYVNPRTAQVLKMDDEDYRVDTFISRLHGELLLGKYGSWLVELAASWAVVMIVTGLFLWWPRPAAGAAKGLGGVLYPRLRSGQRTFWRDIHSVTGIYISGLALFLLFTGLPWAASWGAYLKAARSLGVGHAVKQDWATSSAEALAARTATSTATNAATSTIGGSAAMGDMAGMRGMEHGTDPAKPTAKAAPRRGRRGAGAPPAPDAYVAIDRMVATVAPLGLANPVMVAPPTAAGGNWTAKSDTRNRPLRVNLELSPVTGAVVKRSDFHSKPWIDRVVGTGIAAHEGQLFGALNQLLGVITTGGLMLLSVSSLMMWWRRRPEGVLGAPVAVARIRFSAGLAAFLLAFAVYMPLLGASMIVVGLVERFILRPIPATRRWLGLRELAV